MLQPNNTELDIQRLTEELKRVSQRRRTTPLFDNPQIDAKALSPAWYRGYRPLDAPNSENLLSSNLTLTGKIVASMSRYKRHIMDTAPHWKRRIRSLPLIGAVAAWAYALFRLEATKNLVDDLNVRLGQFEAVHMENCLRQIETLQQRLTRIETNQVQQLRLSLSATSGRSGPSSTAPTATDDSPTGDTFYIDFENAFRGTREDITERLTVYLPYLDKLIGDATAHLVDIGCGRGEWLALMGQHGIQATGVDLNRDMVQACLDQGFDAQCTDALHYLRQQPQGSLAAVTGFHIIEHLPFKLLLSLFDAALRALRPGGLVIFETPNPENLVVGACYFYSDPTHNSPIVPGVAHFMARQRGFDQVEILPLHPYPDSYFLPEDSELAKRFNRAFYGPQDYAILARKAYAN